MEHRSPFPPVFWVANLIEVLERFAYYGIYFGFGIYMEYLGYTRAQLGVIQSIFLLMSYTVPIVSGTFADRYGFKKVLIISYLAYLPSILLLIFTRSFSGIALTMLSIGLAAGIFKPLVSATVRAVTDRTNKTLGFGIFYAMVNVGGSFGPIVAGKLRAISWDLAFLAAAVSIALMLLITVFFYQEPPRTLQPIPLNRKLAEIGVALSDVRFSSFLALLGVLFWLPFWSFFNLCALYVDGTLDTAGLYRFLASVFGTGFANFFSHEGPDGARRVLGETISHTGYIIMLLQIPVSRFIERFPPIPTFLGGMLVSAGGFVFLAAAYSWTPALVFAGIFLFAVGEMVSSPRIQEYITWLAPKEKAGLYMGSNFLAVGLGGVLSGVTYTSLFGYLAQQNQPHYIWYLLALHYLLSAIALWLFVRLVGALQEREQ
ncbi:MAG TPA: MFS transporter [Acidobacteriota bacterium]|nr:MFS transporter [Acidobacteriota bacterium]HRV09646.1 MFS transporter [Acidobacteriota bacterium]